MIRTHVTLPTEIVDQMNYICDTEGYSKSGFVKRAIINLIKEIDERNTIGRKHD